VPRAPLLLLLAVALLLSGCRFDVAADLTISRDGAATAALELRVDREALTRLDALEVDPTAELAAAGGQVPGWEVTRVADEDGSLTVRLTRSTVDAASAADALRELSAGLVEADPALLLDLDIDVGDDGAVRVDGTAELRPPATAGVAVDGEPVGPEAGALARMTAEAVDASFSLTVPGELQEHDADTVDGRTATWNLDAGEARRIQATAAAPGDVTPWLLAGGAAALLLLAVGVLGWRRRRREGAAV
jgi:LPXTG-motif cell wall-anchored protein